MLHSHLESLYADLKTVLLMQIPIVSLKAADEVKYSTGFLSVVSLLLVLKTLAE